MCPKPQTNAHLRVRAQSRANTTRRCGPVARFGLSKWVVFRRQTRGVSSERTRQKERLVRCETPPRAAGGGTRGGKGEDKG